MESPPTPTPPTLLPIQPRGTAVMMRSFLFAFISFFFFCLLPPSLPPSPSAGLQLYRLPHPPTDPPPLYWRIRELDFLCSQVLHTTGKLFISQRLEQSAATFFPFGFSCHLKLDAKQSALVCLYIHIFVGFNRFEDFFFGGPRCSPCHRGRPLGGFALAP